jgi:arabinofuranosyltransferase
VKDPETRHQRTGWRGILAGWLGPALVVLAMSLLSASLCLPAEEDAFIYFRYALHAARGLGLVFNPGERVEGFSSPIWMLLLATGAAQHLQVHVLARVLGIACGMATLIATLWLSSVAGLGRAVRLAVISCLAASYWFLVWAQSGLETPLYSLALVAAVAWYLRTEYPQAGNPPRAADQVVGGALLGLVCLSRPEGLLLPLLILADRARDRAGPRVLGRYVVPVLMVFGSYVFWRHAYFGSWLPNTSVKLYPLHIDRSVPQALEFALYLGIVVLLLPILFLLRERGGASRDRRRLGFLFAAGIALSVGFHFAAGGDYRPGFRYLAPALPLLFVAGWGTLDRLIAAAGWRAAGRLLAGAALAASILGPSLRLLVSDPWARFELAPRAVTACWAKPFAKVSHWGVSQARWIVRNVPPGSVVAFGQMGKAPYLAALQSVDIRFLDTVGWVDRRVAAIYRFDTKLGELVRDLAAGIGLAEALERGRRRRVDRFVAEILARRPDFVLVEPHLRHPGMEALVADPVFRRRYRHVTDLLPAPMIRVYRHL